MAGYGLIMGRHSRIGPGKPSSDEGAGDGGVLERLGALQAMGPHLIPNRPDPIYRLPVTNAKAPAPSIYVEATLNLHEFLRRPKAVAFTAALALGLGGLAIAS